MNHSKEQVPPFLRMTRLHPSGGGTSSSAEGDGVDMFAGNVSSETDGLTLPRWPVETGYRGIVINSLLATHPLLCFISFSFHGEN